MKREIKEYLPEHFVVGAVPFANEDPATVAYNNAAVLLDSETIRMIYSVENGYVYFIAADSKQFLEHLKSGTSLGNALPGMPGYNGDGIYLYNQPDGSAIALIKEGNSIHSVVINSVAVSYTHLTLPTIYSV